jgi:predicted transcriptional regulator
MGSSWIELPDRFSTGVDRLAENMKKRRALYMRRVLVTVVAVDN